MMEQVMWRIRMVVNLNEIIGLVKVEISTLILIHFRVDFVFDFIRG